MELGSQNQVTRDCPVCGARRHEVLWEKQNLRLVRCASCSMIFAAEAPSEFAGGEFYQTTGSAFYSSEDKLAGDYSPVRYTRETSLLHRFCPKGRLLDVGCSTGGFLYYLHERFPADYQVTGTD